MFIRSKKYLLSFALCASLGSASTVFSQSAEQWRRLTGPEGASVNVLFSHGDYLFAGGYSGIFLSTDQGQSWKSVNLGKINQDPAITSFTAIGETLFAGTSGGYIFRSTDNGLNWTPMEFFGNITALAAIGGSLFAGTRCESHAPISCGIHRSTDNGKNWTFIDKDIARISVRSLAVMGAELFAGGYGGVLRSSDLGNNWTKIVVSRDTPYGVYASADNGNTWTPVKDSIEPEALQIPPEWERGALNKQVNYMAAINDVIIAGTDGGVFRSTDRGQNWEGANQGFPHGERGSLAPSIESLAVIGAKIYAGVNDCGLFISDDLGRSWTEASRDLRDITVKGLVRKGEKLFAATLENGVFVSLDQGRHWKATGAVFSGKEILSFAGIGDHFLAWTRNGIYLSTDEGRSWMASETGLTAQYAYSFVVSGAKIFTETNNGLLVSTDQGLSWTKLSVIGEHMAIYALAANEGRLYAGTSNGVFLSTDDGRSWTQLGNIDFRYFSKDVYSLAVSGTSIVAGSSRGNIYLSPDLGKSWTMVNAGVDPPGTLVPGIFTEHTVVLSVSVDGAPRLIAGKDNGLFVSTNRGQTWRPTILAGQVATIKVIGSTIFAGGGFAGGGVLISRDNGMSWAPSNAGLDKENYVSQFAVKGGRIYLAGNGVYVSSDGGLSWTPINEGLTELDARQLFINDTHLFVTTYYGWLFARRL